jgi:hypothetical protein
MSESQHPALRFVGPLKELAEGRTEPDAWLAWWAAHADEVEAVCPRGWFLKLKPKQVEQGASGATHFSQLGACEVLEKLKVPFERSDRYARARQEDFQRFLAAEEATKKARAHQFEPIFDALAKFFPKFARFLKNRARDIDRLEEPASPQEIAEVEQALGAPLPQAYTRLLQCTRALSLDGLYMGLDQVHRHLAVAGKPSQGAETICIGEYWLEGDGDQVLVAYNPHPMPDPPVYYYAHGAGTTTARRLAASVTKWIESLPKSPVFRK